MLDDRTRVFLSQRRFAVLATVNQSGSPQQTVMWYELVDDRILMNTAAGRLKEFNLKRDPRVSVCVEDEYNYLTLTGRAELDYDPERSQADIARLARRYESPERSATMATNFRRETRVTIWITIDSVVSKL